MGGAIVTTDTLERLGVEETAMRLRSYLGARENGLHGFDENAQEKLWCYDRPSWRSSRTTQIGLK